MEANTRRTGVKARVPAERSKRYRSRAARGIIRPHVDIDEYAFVRALEITGEISIGALPGREALSASAADKLNRWAACVTRDSRDPLIREMPTPKITNR